MGKSQMIFVEATSVLSEIVQAQWAELGVYQLWHTCNVAGHFWLQVRSPALLA